MFFDAALKNMSTYELYDTFARGAKSSVHFMSLLANKSFGAVINAEFGEAHMFALETALSVSEMARRMRSIACHFRVWAIS